ncbi:hypothetical protein ElyMa_004952700 [Elysia marginata]|uniref:Uncharacterized protein n=1 Tax=Elysia marginata TaxID=1093978 RepID=A0AAV4J2R7_9GAST|nr:hypothetical protein ElyMa_004952700 [Elysia marginata]
MVSRFKRHKRHQDMSYCPALLLATVRVAFIGRGHHPIIGMVGRCYQSGLNMVASKLTGSSHGHGVSLIVKKTCLLLFQGLGFTQDNRASLTTKCVSLSRTIAADDRLPHNCHSGDNTTSSTRS